MSPPGVSWTGAGLRRAYLGRSRGWTGAAGGSVVDRAGGVVARGEWFEDEAAARRHHHELSADAAALDAAAFRARYRLPP
jgi:hypothetical protein